MEDKDQLWEHVRGPLWSDVDEFWKTNSLPSLLAHYTSLDVLEKILNSNELWFSNPLFMNDVEEVKFGINRGTDQIQKSSPIHDALGSDQRIDVFYNALGAYLRRFEETHLFDTYVFCLSEHDEKNRNGLLSMWRGYGRNGSGAAIIFDTTRTSLIAGSPIVIDKVHYGTPDERLEALDQIVLRFVDALKIAAAPDHMLWVPAAALFERLKMFALFTKHDGFREEREWRAIYMPDRDPKGQLTSMLNYLNGPRGVEPKLRFKMAPIDGVTDPNLSLEGLVHSIILGPSLSSVLAKRSIERMFDILKQGSLKKRLVTCEIPFRALG